MPVTILDMDTRAARHDTLRRIPPREIGKVGGRVEEILAVPLVELIVFEHSKSSCDGATGICAAFARNLGSGTGAPRPTFCIMRHDTGLHFGHFACALPALSLPARFLIDGAEISFPYDVHNITWHQIVSSGSRP